MKLLVSKLAIYVILVLKVFFSYLMLFVNLDFNTIYLLPFSVISFFYTSALAYDPNYISVAAKILVGALIMLSLSLITMLFGIIFRTSRKISIYFTTIFMFIDFIVSFFVGSIILKIACIIASAINIGLCLFVLKSYHRKSLI